MKFEITRDYEFIYNCLTAPHVWNMTADDNTPDKELLFVQIESQYIYIKADNYGLIILHEKDRGCYDTHLALNKYSWGKSAEICKSFIQWVFAKIDGIKYLVAPIPSYNHKTKRLADRLGFKHIASSVGYAMRNNIKYNINYYIFTKDMLCHFYQQ